MRRNEARITIHTHKQSDGPKMHLNITLSKRNAAKLLGLALQLKDQDLKRKVSQ